MLEGKTHKGCKGGQLGRLLLEGAHVLCIVVVVCRITVTVQDRTSKRNGRIELPSTKVFNIKRGTGQDRTGQETD